jgi:hypothetical protein
MGVKFSQATRPSYMPFMGIVKKEIKVPLHLIVDVIIEQGDCVVPISVSTFGNYLFM